ncbi:MAG: lysostaphin resistance A-like protein, partial [Anaerolineae bacterium]
MSERPSALRRFFVKEGKLHPLWRSILYILAYFMGLLATQTPVLVIYALLPMTTGMSGQEVMERLTPEALPLTVLLAAKVLETAMLFLITYLFRRFLDKRSFVSLGFERRPGWLADIAWGIVLGLVLMSSIFLVQWNGGWLTMKGFVWESQPLASILATLGGYFLLFILVGVSEELIFRGYLLSNLQEWRGAVMAVALSSLLFGLFHSLNPHISPLALIHLVLAGA